eukprot:COSAG05_NODE_295_length_11962_cov_6.608952_5_plen_110_part_00
MCEQTVDGPAPASASALATDSDTAVEAVVGCPTESAANSLEALVPPSVLNQLMPSMQVLVRLAACGPYTLLPAPVGFFLPCVSQSHVTSRNHSCCVIAHACIARVHSLR